VSQFMSVAGLAGGPALVGLVYEASGGYDVPFAAVALVTLIGLAILAGYGRGFMPGRAAGGRAAGEMPRSPR
jgi:cyanate permease